MQKNETKSRNNIFLKNSNLSKIIKTIFKKNPKMIYAYTNKDELSSCAFILDGKKKISVNFYGTLKDKIKDRIISITFDMPTNQKLCFYINEIDNAYLFNYFVKKTKKLFKSFVQTFEK